MADGQQAQPQDMPSQVASQEAPEKSGQSGDSADSGESNASSTATFEPLTVTYERLRHTDDVAELHEFARRPLPDRAQQAAFSRATALLEAVAGNQHTPLDDRVFLASDMPFPNIPIHACVTRHCVTLAPHGRCVWRARRILNWIPTRLISCPRLACRANRMRLRFWHRWSAVLWP